MQGYQAISAKLGSADGQHPGLQIDVLKLEIARFAETQTGDAEQPKQAMVDPRQERTRSAVAAIFGQWPIDLRVPASPLSGEA